MCFTVKDITEIRVISFFSALQKVIVDQEPLRRLNLLASEVEKFIKQYNINIACTVENHPVFPKGENPTTPEAFTKELCDWKNSQFGKTSSEKAILANVIMHVNTFDFLGQGGWRVPGFPIALIRGFNPELFSTGALITDEELVGIGIHEMLHIFGIPDGCGNPKCIMKWGNTSSRELCDECQRRIRR